MPYPFASLVEMQAAYGSSLPGCKGANAQWPWRMVADAPTGEINGIGALRGQAIATNGILVAIYQSNGKFVFGHYQWFVCDEPDDQGNKNLAKQESVALARARKQPDLSEFNELFE